MCGGLLSVLLDILPLSKVPKSRRPAWLKSWLYWVIASFRIVIGGFVVFVYVKNGDVLHILECFVFGRFRTDGAKGNTSGRACRSGQERLAARSGLSRHFSLYCVSL